MAERRGELDLFATRQSIIEKMRRQTKCKFPNLQTEIYFVPDQVFHKIKYKVDERTTDDDHPVLKQVETPLNDFSADKAEDHVIRCLRHIIRSQAQPMVVLSNYFAGDFLNEKVDYDDKSAESASAAPTKSKSTKSKARDIVCPNLKNLGQDLGNTEFDNLLISPSRFVLIETKALGFCDTAGSNGQSGGRGQPQGKSVSSQLRERVEKAMDQLSKCEELQQLILANFPIKLQEVPVVKCIALPFSKRSTVQTMMDGSADLTEALMRLFKTSTPEDTLDHFLCEEQGTVLKEDVTPNEVDLLLAWWKNLTESTAKEGCVMSSDEYEQVVSMFCGPYSKLDITRGNPPKKKPHRRAKKRPASEQVRTVADCVHLTGLRFGRSILREDQIQILDSRDPFVFLAGPPGSGKTLLLGLKAEEWAKADDKVVIFGHRGIGWGSLVSLTLRAQVVKHTPEKSNNIRYEEFSKNIDSLSFMQTLIEENKGRGLRLIIDECPIKADESFLHRRLGNVHRHLGEAKAKLQSMQAGEESKVNEERKAVTEEKQTSGNRDEAEMTVVDQGTSREFVGKIQHQLREILSRLVMLQPENQRPPITQSTEWKSHVGNIELISKEMQTLIERIRYTPMTSCSSGVQTEHPQALEEAAKETLEASGFLFNVETAMDFFVIDDILVTLATQHKDKDIKIWASGIYPSYEPVGFVQKQLQRCLRCPPRVQQVLDHVEKDISEGPGFSYQCDSIADDRLPLPTSGPEVKLLRHELSHGVKEVNDCCDCGKALAGYLHQCFSQGEGLHPEDVIISGSFDISGYDCKFTQTLSQEGISLQYVDDVADETPPPYPGKAFVIGGSPLQGLEAKIVVFLPDLSRIPTNTTDPKQFREGLPDWLKHLGRWNRCHLWFVASRCLSQLVVFTV